MRDFDYDIKEKKSLVASARHRVCGAKSKNCSLPSDNLTKAQWKKLNGPVATIKLGVPMTWGAFTDCKDQDLQRQYVQDLIDRYNASGTDLSRMFGVSQPSVSRWLHANNIVTDKKRRSKEHHEMWYTFCNGVVGGGHGPYESDVGRIVRDEPEEGAVVLDSSPILEEAVNKIPTSMFASMTFDRIPTEADLESLNRFFADKKIKVTVEVETV